MSIQERPPHVTFLEAVRLVEIKYGNIPQDSYLRAVFGAKALRKSLGDDLRGMVIVDLFCGSVHSTALYISSEPNSRQFEPWLPRILLEMGAHVIGVDIMDNSEEEFESHKVDLTDPFALDDVFVDASVDAVNISLAITSPTLGVSIGDRQQNAESKKMIHREVVDMVIENAKRYVRDKQNILTHGA